MSKHTPGPWRWEFNEKHKQLTLVGGVPKYDLTIMGFSRWGMWGAGVDLRETSEGHESFNCMYPLKERQDWIQPFPGRDHHAHWCAAVNHPDMVLMQASPDLLEALEACLDALWEGTREVKLDGTMMFGHGYDWDGWESYRWELHTRQGSFAIWPAHGTYSAYGGLDGSYWNQCFASASEAKAAIVKYVAKIDPEHPASKAYAAIAKARGE